MFALTGVSRLRRTLTVSPRTSGAEYDRQRVGVLASFHHTTDLVINIVVPFSTQSLFSRVFFFGAFHTHTLSNKTIALSAVNGNRSQGPDNVTVRARAHKPKSIMLPDHRYGPVITTARLRVDYKVLTRR